LRGRRHESYQRVPHGLGDRVSRGAVERHAVDYGADDDAAAHELSDGVAHVLVISPKSVDPSDNEHVTGPELVE
jgi:hypothetical protein